MNTLSKKGDRLTGCLLICFSLFLICSIVPAVSLAEDDRDVINGLYQEIMNASAIYTDTNRLPGRMNNVSSAEKDSLSSIYPEQDDLSDTKSEKLQKEIEKIRNDMKARHSETIKFMQDDK